MPDPRLLRMASRLGPRRLARLENFSRLAQGKGWGAATVAQENAAIRQLLGDTSDGKLVILDVGANVGSWTLQALKVFPEAQIHAFEPSARAFTQLQSAVAGETRVAVHHLALGGADQQTVLYSDSPGSGLASLTKRRLDHFGIEFSIEEPVTMRTLETWCNAAGLDRFDVLKLDVEGHEIDILESAGEFLHGVRVIQFEFGGCNIDTRTYFQDFWFLLTGAGFRLYRLGPAGLAALTRYEEQDEAFITTNFFASRKDSLGIS